MRFQITGQGWPVGQFLIPCGTIIDAASEDTWSVLARGRGIPLNSTALDDPAWQLLRDTHPQYLLGPPPPGSR